MDTLGKTLAFALLATCCLHAGAARASGDFSCTTVWALYQRTYADCDNLPFLSPGNDTRINLQLLLLDAGRADIEAAPKTDSPTPPIAESASPFTWEAFSDLIGPKSTAASDESDANSDFASGEGSRCRSDGSGTQAFQAAIDASPALPAAERTALSTARATLSPTCAGAAAPTAYTLPAGLRSPLGRQFGDYLAGTAAFYGGDFDGARKHYVALQAASQAWLKETARYMVGRAALNQAQAAAFDEYGQLTMEKVDAAALKDAEQAFQTYLHDFPKGRYTASARGLLRRVYWLGNEPRKLAAELDWSFAHPEPGERNVSVGDLVREADNKLLTRVKTADVADPMLLATLDLMAMRDDSANPDTKSGVIKFDDLAAQKPIFAKDASLFAYLLAAHRFYIESDPAGALGYLGPTPRPGPMNNLAFSREVLRGLALEAAKNWADARQLWLRMIGEAKSAFQRPVLDLALASNLEHDGRLADVFAAGSPIRDPQVREVLIRYAAGPVLLAERAGAPDGAARERRVAWYVLLYKDLMRGRYGAFAGDATLLVPKVDAPTKSDDPRDPWIDQALFDWPGAKDGYVCGNLHELAAVLAVNPQQSHGLLCLGEFVRLKELDGNPLDAPPSAVELGGAPSQFTGTVFSRLNAYEIIIADAKAPADDRAYALYRAIKCYAPSGIDECGGHDVPKSERAHWFRMLKTAYARSDWADILKYYW
jgi:TolA-binding protein